MSHTRTIPLPSGAGHGRFADWLDSLSAALARVRRRWRDDRFIRAQQAALRGLDRRTRQDLGLFADDQPWPGGAGFDAELERLRW